VGEAAAEHEARRHLACDAVAHEPAVELCDLSGLRETHRRWRAEASADVLSLVPGVVVEHIGATALASGMTKGDVDLNVRVALERLGEVTDALGEMGSPAQYQSWTATFTSLRSDRYALALGVQVTAIDGPEDFFVLIRNAMRASPELAASYDRCKRAAAPLGPQRYWEAKDRFLGELLVTLGQR